MFTACAVKGRHVGGDGVTPKKLTNQAEKRNKSSVGPVVMLPAATCHKKQKAENKSGTTYGLKCSDHGLKSEYAWMEARLRITLLNECVVSDTRSLTLETEAGFYTPKCALGRANES